MKVTRFNYDTRFANSYLLGEEGGPCVLIDCGDSGQGRLFEYINRHHAKLEAVLLTHGHFDHIAALGEVDKSVPIFLGADDFICLTSSTYNASRYLSEEISFDNILPYPVEDEDEIALPSFSVKAIATPFHTPGSVCYLFPSFGFLFSGDTLFRYGIGRTDLPGGREGDIKKSLSKLSHLDGNIRIYPGHGPSSTLEEALRNNGIL